jgi:2-amino-4-hydroxy-6-hydroxymethyldihydropteridine diphosphokinase
MDSVATAYLGLGSNLGDREAHLADAARALASGEGTRRAALSRVYETTPLGPPGQGPYLNAVLYLETELSPEDLLALLQRVEAAHGRERGGEHWGPRTLDVDLLLYDDRVIDEPALQVPHPHLHERPFVLEPLAELAPDLVHPTLGASIRDLARAVRDPDAVRPWPHRLSLS